MKRYIIIIVFLLTSYLSFSQITFEFITSSVNKTKEQIAEPLTENGFEVTGYGKIFSKYNSHKDLIFQVMYWGDIDNLPQADFLFWNSASVYSEILKVIRSKCKKIDYKYSKQYETYINIYLTTKNIYLYCFKNRDVYTISASSRRLDF